MVPCIGFPNHLSDKYCLKKVRIIMMDLRPHQTKSIEMLRNSIAKGLNRPLLAAPTGFGKTVVAAQIAMMAASKGKRVMFICDRIKLVQQTLETFDRFGIDVGVMQGNHERTNYNAPVQIASIQTLARKQHLPIFDICIMDEIHSLHKAHKNLMEVYNNLPFIGLSATPYSKGLGKYFNDLLVPITTEQLIDKGYLCEVDYYGGRKANLNGVTRRALPTGGTDYDPKSLSDATEKDDKLVGDIIKNWLKWADGRQSIAFAPSIKHSKELVKQFNEAGISAEHIDGYMDEEEREIIYKAHDSGEFMILSCSRLLNTGYDAPKVSCCIDCYPTSSKIVYQQRIGRVLRISEGKDKAIVLDHAGNYGRHGPAESIVPDVLDDGTQRYNEKDLVKEKKETKAKECPQCTQQMVGIRCKCGYEIPLKQQYLDSTDEILTKLSPEQRNRKHTKEDKSTFYSELLLYTRSKSYKESWASHKYRERYGVWPNAIKPHMVNGISDETSDYITSTQIRYSKRINAA